MLLGIIILIFISTFLFLFVGALVSTSEPAVRDQERKEAIKKIESNSAIVNWFNIIIFPFKFFSLSLYGASAITLKIILAVFSMIVQVIAVILGTIMAIYTIESLFKK